MPKYKLSLVTCGNVRLVQWRPQSHGDWPPLLVALCATEGCEDFALDFREVGSRQIPVCFKHGGKLQVPSKKWEMEMESKSS